MYSTAQDQSALWERAGGGEGVQVCRKLRFLIVGCATKKEKCLCNENGLA